MRSLRYLAAGLLAACAGTTRPAAPAGGVSWPAGRYIASAQLEYTVGSLRAGSSARRLVQAEVYIAPEGSMTLITGYGSCREHATDHANVRDFDCGETAFQFILDGGTIHGSGRQECARWEDHPDEMRTARTSAKLTVVSAG